MRVPVLVAWQGGPKAEELSLLPERERIETALETLSALLDVDTEVIRDELVGWNTHDWARDPFSLGAYSYAIESGLHTAERVRDTLGVRASPRSSEVSTSRRTLEKAIRKN